MYGTLFIVSVFTSAFTGCVFNMCLYYGRAKEAKIVLFICLACLMAAIYSAYAFVDSLIK